MLRTTSNGLALIRAFERLEVRAYRCPAGVVTIGYGHTAPAGPPPVRMGDRISREQAEAILRADIDRFEDRVAGALRRNVTAPQFDALVSLAFNIGLGNFAKSSVLRLVNAGDERGAAQAFLLWNKARQGGRGPLVEMRGLTRRRRAERLLFEGRVADALQLAGAHVEPMPQRAESDEPASPPLAAAIPAAPPPPEPPSSSEGAPSAPRRLRSRFAPRASAAPTPINGDPTMHGFKSLLASRTAWANAVGLVCLALDAAGRGTGAIDPGALVDAGMQVAAGASFIASTIFRAIATKRIGAAS